MTDYISCFQGRDLKGIFYGDYPRWIQIQKYGCDTINIPWATIHPLEFIPKHPELLLAFKHMYAEDVLLIVDRWNIVLYDIRSGIWSHSHYKEADKDITIPIGVYNIVRNKTRVLSC